MNLGSSERFRQRKAERMPFPGKDQRDAKKWCPGDVNYDPKTLYLPPDFSKCLSGAQGQWWEVKSKDTDKVLFFKGNNLIVASQRGTSLPVWRNWLEILVP
ncbi:DNA mismatch repair protein msh6 [Ancistrocladus abbreviatus]